MRTILSIALVVALLPAKAQVLPQAALDSARTYRSLERALAEPDKVFRLDLSGKKLKEVPEGIRQLRYLNALDLSGNKLKTLPAWMGELVSMQEFRASRNKLKEFPAFLCQWKQLKRLDLSRNALPGLPKCIGGLRQLVSLDLWDNDLVDFPAEMERMEALRFLDLRNIQFEQVEMDRIQEMLPRTKIHFSAPCNCGM